MPKKQYIIGSPWRETCYGVPCSGAPYTATMLLRIKRERHMQGTGKNTQREIPNLRSRVLVSTPQVSDEGQSFGVLRRTQGLSAVLRI